MSIVNRSVASTGTTQLFLASGQNAITTMLFCNVSATTDATLNVYVVPYGSNPGTSTQILNTVSIPATETFVCDTEKLILEDRDAVYAQATVAGIITATLSSISTS